MYAAAGKPAPALLNTSSISSPDYWPHTTADATAAALTLRQQTQALAALRVAALQELRQEAAATAALQEEARRQAAKDAAQAEKQVRVMLSLSLLGDACWAGTACCKLATQHSGMGD
jgi:hypothetical protein